MDWNLFWTAFGAIGGTLGALATFIAVIVALWQTKFSYKKKLQLSFSDNITIVPENGNKFYHYVGVTITNIGNRDVVIQNWGFELDDGSQMLIVPDTSPLGRVLQVKLPYRLQIVETAIREKVDIVGLSGLITPSLEEMVHVVTELQRAGLDIPVMIGRNSQDVKKAAFKLL